jgi:hypothetical protein
MTHFEEAQQRVNELVERFRLNPPTSEAAVRIEFINPLFEALGWDVSNRSGYAEQYKEVVHEDSVLVGTATKAPDYSFRIGGVRKFFVEAKKPSISVKNDPSPAYQLRRYAWSAKLPLSILTDFEEFAVYDCTHRPKPTDKAATRRILYCTADDYAESFRDIYGIFARESILRGSFDRYAEKARGTAEVDKEFLKEIEGWRVELARNIALRNQQLNIDQLNEAVQRVIDRIIFLRMAEDRGIEPQGRLLALVNAGQIYPRFGKLCRDADAKYNSGLFDFKADAWTLNIDVDDKVLKAIIESIYYPTSPYEFSVLPADILGNVYEQFLGKVIRLTAGHQAKVEEKPEVKKAGGVYYTPKYIVDYIVEHTVGERITGKSPKQIKDFRILDPACGSGSFLLGAYQYLLDHCLAWYVAHDPEKHPRQVYRRTSDEWALTTTERKRILIAHIFGVDLDRQAVEVTKLSLLLKVLEGETADSLGRQMQLFRERALPNLSDNIKCGNSLIGPDYFDGRLRATIDPAELRRVNPFDWRSEFPQVFQQPKASKDAKDTGFDAVIGNPPYVRIQIMKEWAPAEVEFYKQAFRSAQFGNYDIYVVFIEQGLKLLNAHGRLGYICPHKFMTSKYGEGIRGVVAEGQYLEHVLNFGDAQVFDGPTTYTCLLFLDKAGAPQCDSQTVTDLGAWLEMRANGNGVVNEAGGRYDTAPGVWGTSVAEAKERYGKKPEPSGPSKKDMIPAKAITSAPWNLSAGSTTDLLQRLTQMPVKLADVADRIFQGLVTGADSVFVLTMAGRGTYFSKATQQKHRLEKALMHPVCKGSVNLRRYHVTELEKSILFPYKMVRGQAVLLTPDELAKRYPYAWEYLQSNRKALQAREHGKWKHAQWYALGRSQNLNQMEQPKLLTPSIAAKASFSYDQSDFYYFLGSGGGGGGGYGITLKPECNLNPLYLLGLLNSKLLDYVIKANSTQFRGGYFAFNRQYIERMPIRTIDQTRPDDKKAHLRMVRLAESMLVLHKEFAASTRDRDKELLQRQIDATDRQIDELVYQLYGLTDKEIRIVEDVTE